MNVNKHRLAARSHALRLTRAKRRQLIQNIHIHNQSNGFHSHFIHTQHWIMRFFLFFCFVFFFFLFLFCFIWSAARRKCNYSLFVQWISIFNSTKLHADGMSRRNEFEFVLITKIERWKLNNLRWNRWMDLELIGLRNENIPFFVCFYWGESSELDIMLRTYRDIFGCISFLQ